MLEADFYDYRLAIDPVGGRVIPNATAQVYAMSDTSFTTPLAITDVTGATLTELVASPTGVFPQFMVPSGETQVMLRTSGGVVTPAVSAGGERAAAEQAQLAAEAAATEAANAAAEAAVARTGAEAAGTVTVFYGPDDTVERPSSPAPVIWVGYTGVVPLYAAEFDLVFTSDSPGADVTGPTAGTLSASSITTSGFTLTVSGAADETALHSSPYAFTLDGGSTWSAYQSGTSYIASSLTEDTPYTVQHRVRDAAGNVSYGTPQVVTTDSTGSTYWTNFSAETVGAALPTGWTLEWGDATSFAIVDLGGGVKALRKGASNTIPSFISWDAVGTVGDVELLMKVRYPSGSGASHVGRVRGSGTSAAKNSYNAGIRSGESLYLAKYVGNTSSQIGANGTGALPANTWHWVRFRVIGTSLKVKIWADGGSEPGTWMLEETDTSLTSGKVGVGIHSTQLGAIEWGVVSVATGGGTASLTGA